ncbi:MAG: OmpH family outer membrane protein [Fervidobacterium sp.]|jgi:outer membrane protein|uniref:Molecular chaperone Skp n=1 Tax=Fervidobacterium pennivorans TaxID=93466 RepID=A0A172T345_FERPE|nr:MULTISPECIES: OmpH family outer membrane protein [Fervidobacterium]ANE41391.1 molecular chaperone Skp [Fervidobacterium pennivorans]MDM7321274.1 OmpH family outer membrane protein [Fervidobacterium sp.]NPU89281.1 OmpH family outer membrane protein [Fervidobacterium sp.]QIV77806.1 OmpH family outer membrane protein [Fervidobacterium pennivorans subsp. keratinolyticus]
MSKYFFYVLVATFVVLAVIIGTAADSKTGPKLGYIDPNKVLQNYDKWVNFQKQMQDEIAKYQAELDKIKDQNQKQQKYLEYQQLINNKIAQTQQQIEAEILAKVKEYAEVMGYDFIFNSTTMAYGSQAYNITDAFIKYLKTSKK